MKSYVSIFILLLLGFLFCKAEKKIEKPQEIIAEEKEVHDVYVCPMECDNGMNYYLEGKCDLCHINLIKQE